MLRSREDHGDEQDPIEGDKVEIQLFTTLKCNIACDYCVMDVGGALGSQGKPTYTVEELVSFVRDNLSGKSLRFTFFGGEPLLNRKFIREVMAAFPSALFQLQTNGTLLDKVDDEMLGLFSNALVSLDGDAKRTDAHRGSGVHDRVVGNVRSIKGRFGGNLTARMTWLDAQTCSDDVMGLLEEFDFVHFQFAQDKRHLDAESIALKKANLTELLERCMPMGALLPVIPVMGAARAALHPELAQAQCSGKTQCRVSTSLVNIRPDGDVYACPDMTWEPSMRHGSVKENWLSRSPLQMTEKMPCHECSARDMCLGNCLKNLWMAYEKNDQGWKNGITDPTCSLVRHFMSEARRLATREGWAESLSAEDRSMMLECEVYDFVEIAP